MTTNNQTSLHHNTPRLLQYGRHKTEGGGGVRNSTEKVYWLGTPSKGQGGIPFPFNPCLAPEVTSWKQSQHSRAKTNNVGADLQRMSGGSFLQHQSVTSHCFRLPSAWPGLRALASADHSPLGGGRLSCPVRSSGSTQSAIDTTRTRAARHV